VSVCGEIWKVFITEDTTFTGGETSARFSEILTKGTNDKTKYLRRERPKAAKFSQLCCKKDQVVSPASKSTSAGKNFSGAG